MLRDESLNRSTRDGRKNRETRRPRAYHRVPSIAPRSYAGYKVRDTVPGGLVVKNVYDRFSVISMDDAVWRLTVFFPSFLLFAVESVTGYDVIT